VSQKETFRCSDSLQNPGNQFFLIHRRVSTTAAVHIGSIIGQRLPKRLDDADVVNDQAVTFPFCHAVGTGDGLHQRVRFQRLIQIEEGQALHIEAGEPHGADKHDPERVGRIFEFLVQLPLFHFFAVRLDIQAPLLEGLNLILLLTDDHSHFRFLHPLQLAFQLLCLLLRGVLDAGFQRFNFSSPVFLRQIIHPHTGHLVQADKHSLAACPQVRVMTDKISGNGFQTRSRRQ